MRNILDKLYSRGATALSDSELLSVLAEEEGMGDALLLCCNNSLPDLAGEDIARLRMMAGLGRLRAQRFAVAAEYGRRVALRTALAGRYITTSLDVVDLFRPLLENVKHEECWVVHLSSSNRILELQQVSSGGVQKTVVDHRLIFKMALERLSTQLVMVHNHPSGTALPSPQDKSLTQTVIQAAALFDIHLIDHIIIARTGHFSFSKEGLIK